MPITAVLSPPPSASSTTEVVVTGIGILTAMGCGWRENADGFRAGKTALGAITAFDASRQGVQLAGEARLPAELPPNQLTPARRRRVERAGKMLLHAASEALSQAGLTSANAPSSLEIVLGTSAGAMAHGENFYRSVTRRERVSGGHLSLALNYQVPVQAGLLAEAFALDAPTTVISNACASGANALGHAFQLICSGRSEAVVAGGYDALCQLVFAGFESLRALSRTLPRPFDANRDGLALGEGAAVLVMESRAHAEARGATILGVISGYGMTNDVHHLTQPHPEGVAALASMTMACEVAGLEPNEIQYLNSHGTGTPLNDPAEAAAIAAWAGEATSELAVSSTKGAIGHLLGGAGAVEAAICLIAMNEGFLPATANVQVPDPCCAFELVTQPRPAELVRVLSNSFGFGGCNASLVMQREVDANRSECPGLREAAQAGPLSITGFGAVSPAGWGTAALIDALNHGMALPESLISPPKNAVAGLPSFPVRTVPRPVPDRALASHPRMRRATPVSLFAAAAALEALGPERAEAAKSGALRVGLIYTLLNGTVSFCGRFFGEVLADPATASPILFPETVFNAPASHLAALLGLTGPCASLVGDSAQFLAAIEMASLWLDLDQIDLALIVGAEEHDWLASAAADLLKLGVPLAEGAACIAVERGTAGIGIERLATRHPVKAFSTRGAAAAAARSALGAIAPDALVVDDCCGHAWSDAATAEAWADWAGPRRSPDSLLGHGLSAAGAWQCVAACHELMAGRSSQAVVATTGFSQRAAAMHLCRRA